MDLEWLLLDQNWDAPFFKELANNDTLAAPGHQGGVVIPKNLRQYFPSLNPASTSAVVPTTDKRISAELWNGTELLSLVDTRYQIQTWGGTRVEARLTDNLSPLRRLARGGDYLLIQRHATTLDQYRLILVAESNDAYALVLNMAGNRRWGVLIHDRNPVDENELASAEREIERSSAIGFTLIEHAPSMVETRRVHLARTAAFRRIVVRLYGDTCCVCRSALVNSHGFSELEAAHIVPRHIGGINDARNGLGLCRRHHWAFDRGLFGVDASRCIYVPDPVRSMAQNEPLNSLHGAHITEALEPSMVAHADALAWHMEHIVSARSH